MSEPQIFPRFAGKTVLVTGAGTGFGAEIAVRAAQEGAKVAVHYRSSKAGAEATLERIREAGSDGILVQADIGSWDEIKRMADEVLDGVRHARRARQQRRRRLERADVRGTSSRRRPSTPSSTSTSRARSS